MAQTICAKSLKNYKECSEPYYVKEIVPYVVERKLFKHVDVGRLGNSAEQIGMGKMRAKSFAGKFVVEFFNKATMHGFNHVSAPRRHIFERGLAVSFIGVALGLTVVFSLNSWHRYQHNASTMILDYNYKTFEVPKPALTVCPYDSVSTDKFPWVFKKYGVDDTPETRNFFLFISKPNYATLNQTPMYKGAPPEKWIEILRDLYVDVEISGWDEKELLDFNVSSTEVVTEKGVCTTVFGTYSSYANLDYWLSDSWTVFPATSIPTWTFVHRDDRVTLNNMPRPSEESISLHHPEDLPRYNRWFSNRMSGVVDMKTTVRSALGSDQLRKLSESQRPCNFPEDGNLKLWPVYTRTLCLSECRFNLIKSKCGCYPYFARPVKGIPICNVTQLHCIGNMSALVISLEIKCDCPLSCSTSIYSRLSITTSNDDKDNLTEFVDRTMLNINLVFPYFTLRYEVIFGFNDFLVSVGGAAGLFLGASIISFIEILYYFTLRLFWYKKNIFNSKRE